PDHVDEFEPARIAPLLDYLLAARPGHLYYEDGDRRNTTSAAIPFTLKVSLKQLLRYGFNPAIPAYVLTPSSVRWDRWNTGKEGLARLQQGFPPSGRPVIVRGTEREEITPNLATGTYFAYDVDRALILCSWRGRPLLINLSRQRDRSTVGKKGAVLGADADWDYFYSGEKGMARPGLGWVSSYMYKSFSIGIFYGAGEGVVRGGICKWLNAGGVGRNWPAASPGWRTFPPRAKGISCAATWSISIVAMQMVGGFPTALPNCCAATPTAVG
ncbi:MAG: hypothetical protein P8Z70_14160, partial [Desulfuromonadales bacterium]